MTERMKLTVLELKDLKSIGDKGAQKLGFKARDGEREQWYFTFSKRLFPLVIKGQTLEADVETVVSVRGDNTYTDRKITEIYIAGQPSRLPQALAGVQVGFQKDTASIETQVAFKGMIELMVAGIVRKDDPLGKAALGWASKRLNGVETLSPSVEVPTTLTSAERQSEITKLAQAKGVKTQEGIDQIKFDAGVRVVPLKELTAEEGDKLIAYLEKMQKVK